MNNKGFAITTIVFSLVVFLALILILSLAILKDEYIDQKEFNNNINEEINDCLKEGTC